MSPATFELMTTPKPELKSPEYGYGFGVDTETNVVGHSGGFAGISSNLDIFKGTHQDDLPLRGSSRNFVGADQGDVAVSVFLFHGEPGSGPGSHRHPYDEVQFIREGRGLWTVNGEEFEAGPATSS